MQKPVAVERWWCCPAEGGGVSWGFSLSNDAPASFGSVARVLAEGGDPSSLGWTLTDDGASLRITHPLGTDVVSRAELEQAVAVLRRARSGAPRELTFGATGEVLIEGARFGALETVINRVRRSGTRDWPAEVPWDGASGAAPLEADDDELGDQRPAPGTWSFGADFPRDRCFIDERSLRELWARVRAPR